MVRLGRMTLVFVAVFGVAFSRVTVSDPRVCPVCEGEECNKSRTDCEYGVFVNYCGHYVCAQGPDDICGGWKRYKMECGEGMTCNACGWCSGCYIKRPNECSKKTCMFDSFNKIY